MPTEACDCTEAVSQVLKGLQENETERLYEKRLDTIKKNDIKIKQLNFFDLLSEYPNGIISNTLKETEPDGYSKANGIDMNKNVLICLVKKDNTNKFINGNATIYYTGKRFPSTIDLGKLYYFAPYLSGMGIRDLYKIKITRVGTRKEGEIDNNPSEYRLVFEIEYVKTLFPEYRQIPLEIWHTYADMILKKLISSF